MITRAEAAQIHKEAAEILLKTGIVVHQHEIDTMEIVDFGLSEIRKSGVQIITLVDTVQIAVKILVMLSYQTEPEHSHPKIKEYPGKEETIRCEWGELFLYGPGEPCTHPKGNPPEQHKHTYTVWHELVLHPGEQITFQPNTPHWFQAGPEGAVLWSFSTKVVDTEDIFTDPQIKRETVVTD